jgi:hypothetical protein
VARLNLIRSHYARFEPLEDEPREVNGRLLTSLALARLLGGDEVFSLSLAPPAADETLFVSCGGDQP